MIAATATLAVPRVAACCWSKVSARRKQPPGWREGLGLSPGPQKKINSLELRF